LASLNLLENMRLREGIGFGRAAVVGADVGRNDVAMYVEDRVVSERLQNVGFPGVGWGMGRWERLT